MARWEKPIPWNRLHRRRHYVHSRWLCLSSCSSKDRTAVKSQFLVASCILFYLAATSQHCIKKVENSLVEI